MELLSIGKFAKAMGVTTQHLRNLHATGQLIPTHITAGGTRYYSSGLLKRIDSVGVKKPTIGYCRVSTPSQKDDLETQVQNVKTYMIAKGYEFDIIRDVGSGINYKKKGLKELIDKINGKEVERVVILYKDRLIRFGFEIIEYLCEINGVELVIIDHECKSKEEELTDDLIQVVTVFANRLYGQRSRKTKKLIDEVKNIGSSDKDTIDSD